MICRRHSIHYLLTLLALQTFAQWQQRKGEGGEQQEAKRELLRFMEVFKETFSRPVRRIRFLGLFDTVNSVPRFENAWMQRSKFPYTARSSAKVIRHACGIDERRAKFRQDLVSEVKPSTERRHHRHRLNVHHQNQSPQAAAPVPKLVIDLEKPTPAGSPSIAERPPALSNGAQSSQSAFEHSRDNLFLSSTFQHEHEERDRANSLAAPLDTASDIDIGSERSGETASHASHQSSGSPKVGPTSKQGHVPQDILEMWFPGAHADIGGGWPLDSEERVALSHGPLVWMVHEAQRAGLRFDPVKLRHLNCADPNSPSQTTEDFGHFHFGARQDTQDFDKPTTIQQPNIPFHDALDLACTKGNIHDCLEFNQGLPHTSVLSWKIMEYLPFRRMDLQEDGSWKPIRWPLPAGEVRDIPREAYIHNSAIRRMKADPNYRPGNLIVGGGGRGMRRAPKEKGMGEWDVVADAGDPVRERYARREAQNNKPGKSQ